MAKSRKTLLPADQEERKENWKDFKSNVETYWEHMREIQKTNMEMRKEAWNKVFPKLLEMQDNIAAVLPEEIGTLKTKDIVGKVREFQEMANKHAMEQAENYFDFCMKAQEQTKNLVRDAVQTIEDKLE
jgi:hypothetical protein